MRLRSAGPIVARDEALVEGQQSPSASQTLPAELFDIIASFLSHDHFLATIASLNRTYHGVKAVTQRTLWETLVVDGPWSCVAAMMDGKKKSLDGFQYVKCIICSQAIIDPATILRARFPELVMTSTFDQSFATSVPGGLRIHLLKPLSSRTAFSTILSRPVRYSTFNHAQCPKPSAKRSKTGFYKPCLMEMEKPLVRQMETLGCLRCDEGAYLFADDAHGEEWFTPLRTHPSPVPYFEPMIIRNKQDVDTTMELLKLSERNEDPRHVVNVDTTLFQEYRTRRRWPCFGKEIYDSRTWEVEATVEGITLFIDQFAQLAPSHPGLLLSRCRLFLLGDQPPPILEPLLNRYKQVYIDNVTLNSQIMPYDPRPPPSAVTLQCLATYGGAIGFISVSQLEEGPVFSSEVMIPRPREEYDRDEMRRGEAAYDMMRMR